MKFYAKLAAVFLATITWAASGAWAQSDQDKSEQDKNGKEPVVAVFSLAASYTEAPLGDDPFFGSMQESFHQLITRMKKARDDKDVKAVVFLCDYVGLGTGQMEEIRGLMEEIKKSGKEIHAHADSISMRTYVLLSGASHVSVVPNGDLWLTGLYAETLHVRSMLDKIGVTPDYIAIGDYKSAAEMFTRKEPSPAADENLNWLLDGLYDGYIRLITEGRGKSVEEVKQWIDQGLYSPDKAKELGIINEVEYRHDFENRLREKYGDEVKFDRKYGKQSPLEMDFSSPFGVLKFYMDLLTGPKKPKSDKDAVGVVYVEGPILAGQPDPNSFPFGSSGIAYSTPIRKALEKAARDESIKAVVLRVNSPGGSAVGSEVILQATRRVKEKKPFVVSMGDVAGSGGYYVACGAETIFADPSTITASIGVVAGKLATETMWNKIGITFKDYSRGKNAGILSSGEPFTDEQREVLRSWMGEVYDVFKGHVREIRGDRLKKDLEELAGGRVYTGRQALELGLVDQLGGLEEAIQHVAQKAELKEYDIRVLPRPKSFAELLTESFQGESDEEPHLSLGQLRSASHARSLAELALPYLRGLEPERLRAARMAFAQLHVLQKEQISLTMPIVTIRER